MDDTDLATRFEEHRVRLRAIATRMLGSESDADDAVQETWLRLARLDPADRDAIENLAAWLTTVVSRVCLDLLRSRSSRREDAFETEWAEVAAEPGREGDPEHEAELADSIGVALLVVLEQLTPAERVAFVLHDLFGVPFDEVGEAVGRNAAPRASSRAALAAVCVAGRRGSAPPARAPPTAQMARARRRMPRARRSADLATARRRVRSWRRSSRRRGAATWPRSSRCWIPMWC